MAVGKVQSDKTTTATEKRKQLFAFALCFVLSCKTFFKAPRRKDKSVIHHYHNDFHFPLSFSFLFYFDSSAVHILKLTTESVFTLIIIIIFY